jgi:hypothetical protein
MQNEVDADPMLAAWFGDLIKKPMRANRKTC